MGTFQYQARETSGTLVSGVIEAEDRQGALTKLAERGLFPSHLEASSHSRTGNNGAEAPGFPVEASRGLQESGPRRLGKVSRKEITAFTREMATLLAVAIPIPSALEGLSEEERNPSLQHVIRDLAASVRGGKSLSAAMEAYPKLFGKL